MLAGRRVAIVGLSPNPSRISHQIAEYLQRSGYSIIPINPTFTGSILSEPCVATLAEAPGPIDFVNVFRRSEFCEAVTRDAIAAGAKGVWLQSGIASDGARKLAEAAGIDFVQDRCVMVEHARRRR